MDRRRVRPPTSEEIDYWTHTASALPALSEFYSNPAHAETIGRINRLMSAWPADEVLPAEGIDSVKSTYKKLSAGFEEIARNTEKELKMIAAASEKIETLIALRKAPNEVLSTEKRAKRPRGHSPAGTPVPTAPSTGNGSRSITINVPPRNSVGPAPSIPFSREPKARREALAAQLPLMEGRKVAFHPHLNKAGGDVENDTWILAIVTKCINADKNRYEVRDPEPQEDGSSGLYNTTLRSIIPLPDPNAPKSSPSSLAAYHEFTKGATVMALYPDTSTFYRAQVLAGPRDLQGRPSYKLKFEDDDNQEHLVAAEWVVEWPGS